MLVSFLVLGQIFTFLMALLVSFLVLGQLLTFLMALFSILHIFWPI